MHLGRIRGTLATVGVASTSVGPFIMGGLGELTGTHAWCLALFALLPLPIAVNALIAKPPPYPPLGRGA
jgi:hypothetical protein